MLKKILSVSGKPGLYKLISQGKNMLIVERVDETKKRMPIYAHDRVTSLGDIAIYTDADEVPLGEVLEKIRVNRAGKPVELPINNSSKDTLFAFMAEVLPNYDRDRVHFGDVKKLFSWYNLLVADGMTTFVEPDEAAGESEAAANDALSEDKKVEDAPAEGSQKGE